MGLNHLILIYWNVFVMEVQLVLTHISLSCPSENLGICLVNKYGTPSPNTSYYWLEGWLQKQIYRKQNEFIISLLSKKSAVMSCHVLTLAFLGIWLLMLDLNRKAWSSCLFHFSIIWKCLDGLSHVCVGEVLWERWIWVQKRWFSSLLTIYLFMWPYMIA